MSNYTKLKRHSCYPNPVEACNTKAGGSLAGESGGNLSPPIRTVTMIGWKGKEYQLSSVLLARGSIPCYGVVNTST